MTTSPTTGFSTKHYIKADNSFAGSYQGPDDNTNPYLGFTEVPFPPTNALGALWQNNTWVYPQIPASPIQAIEYWVQQVSDWGNYPGALGDIYSLIINGAWNIALIRMNAIKPQAQDQTAYNNILGIIQAQIGGG